MSVVVWGVPTESPVELLLGALARRGAEPVVVHPRRFLEHDVDVRTSDGELRGSLRVAGVTTDLRDIDGVYVRPIEPELVPPEAEKSKPCPPTPTTIPCQSFTRPVIVAVCPGMRCEADVVISSRSLRTVTAKV